MRAQRGFTLVEVMVALLIGLFLLGGLLRLVQDNRRTFASQNQLSQLQDAERIAMTMITERPWWQNLIIILSAIPIALAVNLIRIVVTGLLYLMLGPESEIAKHFFHDLAGWFMMPLAFVFLYVEMKILEHILIEESSAVPVVVGFGGTSTTPLKRTAPTQIRQF